MTKKLRRPGTPNTIEASPESDATAQKPTPPMTVPENPAVAPPMPPRRKPPMDRPAWPSTPASRVDGLPKPEPAVSTNAAAAVNAEEVTIPAAMPLPGFSPSSNENGLTVPPISDAFPLKSATQTLPASATNGVGLASPVELRATRPLPAEAPPVSRDDVNLEARFSELLAAQRRLMQSVQWLTVGMGLCLLLSAGALYRSQPLAAASPSVDSSAPAPRSPVAVRPARSMPVKTPVAPKPVAVAPKVSEPTPGNSMPATDLSGKPTAETDETNFVVNANALGTGAAPASPPKKH